MTVRYAGKATPALDAIDLHVDAPHTLTIVGPSGAGKTTLLRAIAGLAPATGSVTLGARRLDGIAVQDRRVALVFQHDALVGTMTIRENLRFASRAGVAQENELAESFALASTLARRPAQLSGGERQRASLARALLSRPDALLLDEPFAHLDPPLRVHMRRLLAQARERVPGPMLYVTHDHTEALALGDRLAVMIGGRIADVGEPQRVYDRPAHVDVARFLGERAMNVIDSPHAPFEAHALIGIRPERVRIHSDGEPARILARERTGADVYLRVQMPYGELLVRAGNDAPADGMIGVVIARDAVCIFDRATGTRVD